MKSWPIVERWDSHPLDLKDAQGRFRRSEWNYFLVDQEAGALMGYWLAEEGQEDLSGDEFDEVLHVIEGRLLRHVRGAGADCRAGGHGGGPPWEAGADRRAGADAGVLHLLPDGGPGGLRGAGAAGE